MRYEIILADSSGNKAINTTTELYMEFTDLDAFTQYSVTVKSINDENKEALSDPKTFNTTELGKSVCLAPLTMVLQQAYSENQSENRCPWLTIFKNVGKIFTFV